jgi:peroxiredoxin family protein
MLFADYFFETLPDGSILMDRELTASSLRVANGDQFTVHVTFDGRILLQKNVKDGSSRTDQ